MVPFSPTRASDHLLSDPPTDCFAIVFPGSAFHRQQGRNERCENAARLGEAHVPGKRLRSNRGSGAGEKGSRGWAGETGKTRRLGAAGVGWVRNHGHFQDPYQWTRLPAFTLPKMR